MDDQPPSTGPYPVPGETERPPSNWLLISLAMLTVTLVVCVWRILG